MAGLRLKMVCGTYDRMQGLIAGDIVPEGIELDVEAVQSPREIFDRVMGGEDFDVAELSTSEYVCNTCQGTSRHIAIPVFPSRLFRHGFIAINRNAGIKSPKHLEGRRIGVPLYTMTAAVWIRGMLEDDHGVDLSGVTWVQGGLYEAGAHGSPKAPPLVKPVNIVSNRSDKSIDELLCTGEIDAYLGSRLPPSLGRHPDVIRLFPDYRAKEIDYYKRTGIHPIMHSLVIKRDTYEANPWVAKSLYDAAVASKSKAWADLQYSGASKVMLPWLLDDADQAADVFGGEPFAYGMEKNRATLETLVEYLHRDHMIDRKPALDELFVDVGA